MSSLTPERADQSDSFVGLMQQVLARLGVDADVDCQTGRVLAPEFDVDGVGMALTPAPLGGPDRVALVCRLGPVPEHRRIAVLERLLTLNLALADEPVRLALDPVDGAALMVTTYRLSELDVDTALRALHLAAGQALRWRAGYFLEEPTGPGALKV